MSLELLKKNIDQEKNLVKKLESLITEGGNEKDLENSINAIKKQIEILNNSVSDLTGDITLAKELPSENAGKESKGILKIEHEIEGSESSVGIRKKDRREYLKQLHVSELSLRNLTKKKRKRRNL